MDELAVETGPAAVVVDDPPGAVPASALAISSCTRVRKASRSKEPPPELVGVVEPEAEGAELPGVLLASLIATLAVNWN